MPVLTNLGRLLAQRRISVEQLSEITGIPLAKLSMLKNGEAHAITFTTMNAICKVLRCQPGELLEYQEPEY